MIESVGTVVQSSNGQVATPTLKATTSIGNNDIVVNQKVRWRLLEAQVIGPRLEIEDGSVEPLQASGTFVGVRFEVQNLSQSSLVFSGVTLVDSEKKEEYSYSHRAMFFVVEEEVCITVTLAPEQTKTCTAVYDTPLNTEDLSAVLTDLDLTSGHKQMVRLNIE